jgi:2-dehydro-3-deoxy-L-rhamnonate dehydrogenase (NAD+)
MTDFEKQTAIITGGAQGIGRAVAERLAKEGARIVLWDRDGALAEATARDIGADACAFEVDIANWDSVQRAMDATRAACGGVEILVNSAGIAGSNGPLVD